MSDRVTADFAGRPEHAGVPFPTIKRRHRPVTRRVAALISYDGRPFAGFQRQPDRRTVEGELVGALQAVGCSGGLGFSSRTDAGVHAEGQVIAFKVAAVTSLEALGAQLDEHLPPEIRVRQLAWAPAGFHPRWSAEGKEYIYRLAENGGPRTAPWSRPLDPELLRTALHDLRTSPTLSGFTAAGAPPTAAPPLTSLEVQPAAPGFAITFRGPAFKRYAIRHMAGCLLAEACGDTAAGTCARVAASPPPYRGVRAPAEGLTLERVFFPAALDPFLERTER